MTRLLTALPLIAALLALLLLGSPRLFAVAVAGVALLAWREFVHLARALGAAPPAAPGALLVPACVLAVGSGAALGLAVLAGAALLGALACLREHHARPRALVAALGATLAGLLWIGLALGAHVAVRATESGALWLLLVYAAVAVGDSAAYYGGSAWGRRPLAPGLSPRKTVEGAACGLLASAAAAAVASIALPALAPAGGAALGLLLGAVGQVGDLVESALKRAAAVKDSSGLLPGHGGVLDRIDAHLLAGLALWLLLAAGLLA